MKDKKKHNLFAKHLIEQILPLFEEFFECIDNNFEEIDSDKLSETYLKDLKNYLNTFQNRQKKNKKFNPYSAFLKDKSIQAKIKNDNPNLSFGDLSKLKGQIWKNLSKEEKNKYKLIVQDSNNTNDIH